MSFNKNTLTFGTKTDAQVNAIPVPIYTYATNYVYWDWWPGMSVFNSTIQKPEYLYGMDNIEGASWSNLAWGTEDCILCYNSPVVTLVEGNVVSLATDYNNSAPAPYNGAIPGIVLTTPANVGKTIGVIRRVNANPDPAMLSVMVATEGMYQVKLAPTVTGNIERGARVIISQTYPGTVEIGPATGNYTSIGVVARYYLSSAYLDRLIYCYIQMNVY